MKHDCHANRGGGSPDGLEIVIKCLKVNTNLFINNFFEENVLMEIQIWLGFIAKKLILPLTWPPFISFNSIPLKLPI